MNFDCPQCGQNIEIDDAAAGRTVQCPTCGHSLLLPSAPGSSKLQKRRRGCGCSTFLFLLLVLAVGGLGYGMYYWKETPDQVWHRLTNYASQFVEEHWRATPTAEPAPTAAATAAERPTPRPDAVAWLIEHKESWPKELILREPKEFPAVSSGKVVGSLIVPAGAVVQVTDITPREIAVDYMGGGARVAVSATDLAARANAALLKAELMSKSKTTDRVPGAVASRSRASTSPEEIREATRDEVMTGLGALYTRAATTFRLFATQTRTASVVMYDDATGNSGRTVRPMRQEANDQWDTTLNGDQAGKFYTFLLDGNDAKRAREVLDPYAVNSVASSARGRITPLTLPLRHGPGAESPTDAIVYEMHVRDFTIAPNSGVENAGRYLGWTETGTKLTDDAQIATGLDHLVELGVTHVELMPVEDFENDETAGNYNWGYITSAFFSPEGTFATDPNDDSRVRELKALVNALHERGLSVIMDVVYNHTAGTSSLLSIAPDQYYRRQPNGSLANGSGCGNEVKSESTAGRRLIIDSLKYWARAYGVDGFRFDLMALIDQETIRQADRELRRIQPGIVLFGEPWTGGSSPLREKTDKNAIRQVPAGAFNDDFRNALKGSPDGDDPGWIQNGSKRDALKTALLVSEWCASPGQSINYMTCHDNMVLWDKLVHSMPGATDALRIETMELGYLALFTAQGVPFIHGGEEFGRSKGGNNNSFEAPDSVNQVDWSLKREHQDLCHYVRDAIALRKAHPLFRLRTRADVRSRVNFRDTTDHAALMFTINGEGVPGETWRRVCVVLNSADNAEAEVALPPGDWMVAFAAKGAATDSQVVSGKVNVRHKSGVVLYQR